MKIIKQSMHRDKLYNYKIRNIYYHPESLLIHSDNKLYIKLNFGNNTCLLSYDTIPSIFDFYTTNIKTNYTTNNIKPNIRLFDYIMVEYARSGQFVSSISMINKEKSTLDVYYSHEEKTEDVR